MKRPLKALIAAILPATLAFSALMSACTDSHTHTLTPVAAKEATCTEAGNIAYWFCDDCDKYFSDAEAKNEISQSQTVIAALEHKWSALWTGGAQGHWHECDVCHEADSVVAHADANTDGVCDVCGYTISAEDPDPDDPIAVEGITLDKTTATVEEGATVTLTATVTPDNATDKTVTWSTSNETIATVSDGVVTGVKAGEVTITAKAGDKSATCTVTVTAAATEPEVVPVTGVTLNQTTVTLDIDQSITLTATVAPENATNKAVTWASDKTDVATVDANGKVTAVAAGTANITVTTQDGGKTATCVVTVNPATEPEVVPVTGVTLSQTAVTLDIDQSITLTATVAPENATNKAVTWVSDKTDIATVDANGKVTAVAAGIANITVTTADGGKTATCAVTVNPATDPEPSVEYEWVSAQADFTDSAVSSYSSGSAKLPSDITVGRFTFAQGTYVEGISAGLKVEYGNINTQKQENAIAFTLNGADNKNAISFTAKGGKTGTVQLYKVGENGAADTLVFEQYITDQVSVTVGYNKTTDTAGSVSLSAGSYYLGSSDGSVRIGSLVIDEYVQASDPASIEVSGGQTEFLVGDEFVSTGLNVTLVYENGRRESLTAASYKLDSSKYVAGTSGTYTITVSYTPAGASAAFTDTYDVDVYAIDSLEVYDFVLGSGRVTQNLQKVFLKDSQFNYDNLAIQAVGKLDGSDKTHTFYLTDSDYTVTLDGDTSTVGEKTVNISVNSERGTATASYKINVVENVFTQPKGTYTVNVNAAGTVAVSNDNVTFTGINDALKYFEITGVPAASAKVINVAAGNYNEKVEVNMPNVSIIGAGAESTVLWYDALNGALDPGGSTTYSTDGSATISIRKSATGFYAENITFKNYWNTQELYEQSKLIAGSGTQAVAALVQADMAKFVNVHFTSYQDTLYAQVGRQYYENCYIEGRTDYVFGYNATAYFTNTELHTILGDSTKNGGYVVAAKGLADGIDVDGIEYGYIFNDCTFTADEGVTPGTVSLARGWDKNMRVVIMNSDISGAYSKEAYGDTSSEKNDRYGKMNADPVAANLIEAGNTGDGAITASLANTCTVITVEEAAKYSNFATIFGTTNGKVTYAEAWVPVTEGETVAVTGVTLDKETLELTVGEGTAQLVATIAPEGATDTRLVWLSSDEKVATVDENGVVTPVGEGNATITVVTVDGNFSDTCTVTVNAADPSAEVNYNVVINNYDSTSQIWTDMKGGIVYFNQDGTYTTDPAATTGIVSYAGRDSDTYTLEDKSTTVNGQEYSGAISTAGGSDDEYRYFAIDLSEYQGRQVTISVIALAKGSGERSIYLATTSSKTAPADALATVTTADSKTGIELKYTGTVNADTLYVSNSNGYFVFAIMVKIV